MNEIAKKANIELWQNRDPQKALKILSSIQHNESLEFQGLFAACYFEIGDFDKALYFYKKSQKKYQEGFCELLLGNEFKAREIWFSLPDNSPVLWGRALLSFINLEVKSFPSFLQIRNFLECDLSHFIRANKLDYAENLISCHEILADLNLEAYKFIGRALMNHGFLSQAYKYFLKSKDLIDNDPEIYFHLGQYFYQTQNYQKCINSLDKCLALNEAYAPAEALKYNLKNIMD